MDENTYVLYGRTTAGDLRGLTANHMTNLDVEVVVESEIDQVRMSILLDNGFTGVMGFLYVT